MSDELFEIAFSGQIAEGADLEAVKLQIGKIFKADENRIAQMFSGRRVIIKRQADEATVAKYQSAFKKAEAICEIKPLSEDQSAENQSEIEKPPQAQATTSTSASIESTEDYVSKYAESDQVPQALLTDPLGIEGGQIEALDTELAPVGSQMQHQIKEQQAPTIDISGIDVAPVGSDLITKSEDEPPPPPDTTGLTMAD